MINNKRQKFSLTDRSSFVNFIDNDLFMTTNEQNKRMKKHYIYGNIINLLLQISLIAMVTIALMNAVTYYIVYENNDFDILSGFLLNITNIDIFQNLTYVTIGLVVLPFILIFIKAKLKYPESLRNILLPFVKYIFSTDKEKISTFYKIIAFITTWLAAIVSLVITYTLIFNIIKIPTNFIDNEVNGNIANDNMIYGIWYPIVSFVCFIVVIINTVFSITKELWFGIIMIKAINKYTTIVQQGVAY